MVKFYGFVYCLFFGIILQSTSLNAQEQLTDFRGSPCCYEFEEILPRGENTYGLARDHQDGVRIFLLDKTQANLVFSNDQDDKISLIEHGLLKDFYYFIYQDRIELFRFSSGEVETYEFDDPLSLNRSQKEALSMGKYGLTLIPESETESLQFYNLSTKRFETRSPSLNREHTRVQLDSFILFTTYENRQGKLFSHNILSDEFHVLHSRENRRLEFIPQNGLLFFEDNESVFISNGRPGTTFLLDDSRHLFKDPLSYQEENEIHIFLNLRSDLLRYIQLDWSQGIIENYSVPTDSIDRYIDHFYRINENELVLADRSTFFKVNMEIHSVSPTEVRRIFELAFSTENAYFEEGQLNGFNYKSEEVTARSELFFNDYIKYIKDLYTVNDSLFYLIGHNRDDSSYDNYGLFAFDLSRDTIIEMLSYGQNGHGLSEAKLKKLGEKLVLQTEDQIFEWTGQDFEPIFTTDFELPIVQFQNKYYFLKYTDDALVSLYEWQDQDQILTVAENIPYNQSSGHIVSNTDQLILMNPYLGAFSVNIEDGTYETLSPYNREIILENLYPIGKNIVQELKVPGRGEEYWSYHTEAKSWVQLQTEDISRPLNLTENTFLTGDYLLNLQYGASEAQLTSISLNTGEQVTLLDENNAGSGFNYVVRYYGSETSIIQASGSAMQNDKFYITDGTIAGTQLIFDLNQPIFLSSIFEFEEDLIFTVFYEDFTKAFRVNSENQQIEEVDKLNPLIPQQYFSLNYQTYTLGYQNYPKQNLTLSRIIDNRVEELSISPYEIAPRHLSSYFTADSMPIIYLSDSLLAISVSLDEKGEELWSVGLFGQLERMTDLNEGPFDSEIKDLVVFGDHLYFTGYNYGVGRQVWRMPLPTTDPNENREKMELLIAPNPTDQFLTIYDMPSEKGDISIVDMSGKVIFKGIKEEGTTLFSQNMQQYPPGMYIVLLRVNGKKYSGKFILK